MYANDDMQLDLTLKKLRIYMRAKVWQEISEFLIPPLLLFDEANSWPLQQMAEQQKAGSKLKCNLVLDNNLLVFERRTRSDRAFVCQTDLHLHYNS